MAALGSHGDVHPILGIGRALRGRGHEVAVAANPLYREVIEQADLEPLPLGEEADLLRAIEDPRIWQPIHSMKVLGGKVILPSMRPLFELIRERMDERLVVAAPVTAFGARIAQEALGVKLATLNLQPVTFRSLRDVPGVPFTPSPKGPALIASAIHRAAYWLADRLFFDPVLLKPTNEFRAEHGLSPIKRPFGDWMCSTTLAIGLFPDWFGMPQPDWPPQARCTGFPLYDESETREEDPELQEFLDSGEPPIVFTAGTAMRHGAEFYETSAQVCRKLGRRGLLLTRFRRQVPADPPRGVAHFDYAPFSRLLPRSAALVYHGGIGTASQALAAGIPHLVVPHSYDQPDNAARLRRLGVGRTLYRPFYTVERASRTLNELLTSEDTRRACQQYARRLEENDSLEETCRLIESL